MGLRVTPDPSRWELGPSHSTLFHPIRKLEAKSGREEMIFRDLPRGALSGACLFRFPTGSPGSLYNFSRQSSQILLHSTAGLRCPWKQGGKKRGKKKKEEAVCVFSRAHVSVPHLLTARAFHTPSVCTCSSFCCLETVSSLGPQVPSSVELGSLINCLTGLQEQEAGT